MSDTVGVELGTSIVRVVVLDRWRSAPRQVLEAEWDPARPAQLVAQLRSRLGPARRIALSLGLSFLHVKHVKLPPAPASERLRILTLEPDRFFPVQNQSLVVSLLDAEDLAFAADADLVASWIQAFEEWAPVESVEAAPLSLARALGNTTGAFVLPSGKDEVGLVELQNGAVHSARRVPAQSADWNAQQLPARNGVPRDFLCALGAARGVHGALDTMLLPKPAMGRIRRRRLLRVSAAALVCLLAAGLSLWALDRSREQRLTAIRSELAVMTPRAQKAVELRDYIAAIDRESTALQELARRRSNPLRVLVALSQRMPEGATVLNIKANHDNWQIDGTARDAAAIVPLLDKDNRFEDVRFLSASSRFQEGDRTYETFSIAFRVRPGD